MPTTTRYATSDIMVSEEHDRFSVMEGNRAIDPLHVKKLKKLMTENGNLTQEMPILVNAAFEIIDGQHRWSALKELGWPVFYQVRENMTLSNVRAINTGNKNWSWYDFAQSFAKLGNNNYIRFVMLADMYPQFGYEVLGMYGGLRDVRSSLGTNGRRYRQGEMKFTLEAFQRAKDKLNMYSEVAEFLPKPNAMTAQAFYRIMQAPGYDHKRMVEKASKYAEKVFNKKWVQLTMQDCMRAYEEMYNFGSHAAKEGRLY